MPSPKKPGPKETDMRALTSAINYEFGNAALLATALTHASLPGDLPRRHSRSAPQTGDNASGNASDNASDNERLEFLGDRVLGLVIAEVLLEYYPHDPEGALARRLNQLVRKETCAKVARQINLGRYIAMSEAERGSGGREKKTILADACEALLGAIFLDGGYPAVRTVIRRLWQSHLDAVKTIRADAKSALQEWAQAHALGLPDYVQCGCEGPPHDPRFETRVNIDGFAPASGCGRSKRSAEQAAARAFLIREAIWNNDND